MLKPRGMFKHRTTVYLLALNLFSLSFTKMLMESRQQSIHLSIQLSIHPSIHIHLPPLSVSILIQTQMIMKLSDTDWYYKKISTN